MKMSYDEEAVLLTKAGVTKDKDGILTENKWRRTEVFAGRKSAGRQEEYKAMHEGIKVAMILGLYTTEYEAGIVEMESGEKIYPTHVEYNGRIYRILRTYGEEREEMELVLEDNING